MLTEFGMQDILDDNTIEFVLLSKKSKNINDTVNDVSVIIHVKEPQQAELDAYLRKYAGYKANIGEPIWRSSWRWGLSL